MVTAGMYCPNLPEGRWLALPDESLTVDEVAQLPKVEERTVHATSQKADLPAFTIGRVRRFRADDSWVDAPINRPHAVAEAEAK